MQKWMRMGMEGKGNGTERDKKGRGTERGRWKRKRKRREERKEEEREENRAEQNRRVGNMREGIKGKIRGKEWMRRGQELGVRATVEE